MLDFLFAHSDFIIVSQGGFDIASLMKDPSMAGLLNNPDLAKMAEVGSIILHAPIVSVLLICVALDGTELRPRLAHVGPANGVVAE